MISDFKDENYEKKIVDCFSPLYHISVYPTVI